MNYFSIVSQQIIIFVIYALIGVIAVKAKVLSKEGLEWVSRLVIKILLPLMIFTNTINGATRSDFLAALPLLIGTAILYLLLYLVSFALRSLSGLKGNERNTYQACTMFGNVGFMGIPLIAALLPEKGMLYVALFTVVDQLVLWTIGLALCLPVEGGKRLSPKQVGLKMINPNTVGIILATLVILLEIPFPSLLNTALTKTGAAASPLAMLYLGGLFCSVDFKNVFKHKEYYLTIAAKMVIFPLIFIRLISLMPGITSEMALVLAIIAATPTMSSVAMLVKAQGSAGEYAAGMVFVTTLFSVLTIPLVCLLI